MNAAAFLQAAEALPFESLEQLVGLGEIVVVAPHPDDESLGCGGLIAAARAMDVEVRLIVVSDGVGSHPNSKTHPPVKLKALREEETLQAVANLGLDTSDVRFLGLPDAAVPTTGPTAETAIDEIVAIASECSATAVFVTWRHDPHCDHAPAAALVDRAAERIGRIRVRPISSGAGRCRRRPRSAHRRRAGGSRSRSILQRSRRRSPRTDRRRPR